MTRIMGEDQVGFNNKIRAQQIKKKYLLIKGRVIKERVQLGNNKLRKNILRVKWAKELKIEEIELGDFYKCKVINRRYIVKAESSLLILVY